MMPAWRVCALLVVATALAAFEGAAAHGGPAARGLLQEPNSSEFQGRGMAQQSPEPSSSPEAPSATLSGLPICSGSPISGVNTLRKCPEGSTCQAISKAHIEATFGARPGLDPGDVGVCAYTSGQLVMLPNATLVPPAMAFFPLNSQTLESFPLPEYGGVNRGASLEADALFGSALRCRQNDSDLVALDPVQYARNGPFTINFWFKPGTLEGSMLSYIFSHTAANLSDGSGSMTWLPNQIQLYMPQEMNPDYGILRAIAKDSEDVQTGVAALEYLDSDGSVSTSNQQRDVPGPLFDGKWHMATLSSQPDGVKGYRMFIDGKMVGQIREGQDLYITDTYGNVYPLQPNAGRPMDLSGNIVLCSRADGNATRHFDGKLAYLGLWDVALNDTQVEHLYMAVATNRTDLLGKEIGGQEAPLLDGTEPGASDAMPRNSTSGKPCIFPALYYGTMTYECIDINGIASCQVDAQSNTWEPCAEPKATPTPVKRYTVDGEECNLPQEIDGQTYDDCFLYGGLMPVCQFAEAQGQTYFKACRPLNATGSAPANETEKSSLQPMETKDGQTCQLPLRYNGATVDNCVNIATPVGDLWCWAEESDAWAPCQDSATLSLAQDPSATGLGDQSAAFLVVPGVYRVTTDGQPCMLPTVVQGEIIDDCIDRAGVPACRTEAGAWRPCAPSGEQEAAQLGALGDELAVADRQTVNGEECLLPVVLRGSLWFDCADYWQVQAITQSDAYATMVAELCPTRAGTWDECAPRGNDTESSTRPFSAEWALNRTAPGASGQLCTLVPDPAAPNTGCNANSSSCFPLPDLGGSVSTSLEGLGFCQLDPAGGTFGIYAMIQAEGLPTPLAHFPLTGGSFASWLVPTYGGTIGSVLATNVTLADDDMFSSVAVCKRSDMDAILLENVPYGVDGRFAINLWARRWPDSDSSGEGFQYLFSHSGVAATSALSPNQVQLYVAGSDHPAAGMVRAVVKDESDMENDLVFVDSDGQVNANTTTRIGNASEPSHTNVNDGKWHMITLSTHADGSKGYVLFIDGQKAGELSPNSTAASGGTLNVTGGDPALIDYRITLCARGDLDRDRFFDGSLANLMIFDSPLNATQVRLLFDQYTATPSGMDNLGLPGDIALPVLRPVNESAPTSQASTSSNTTDGSLSTQSSGGTTDSSSSSSSSSSAGAIAGIVIGVVAGLALMAAVAAVYVLRKRRPKGPGRFTSFDQQHGLPALDAHDPDTPAPTNIQLSRGVSMPVPASQTPAPVARGVSMPVGPVGAYGHTMPARTISAPAAQGGAGHHTPAESPNPFLDGLTAPGYAVDLGPPPARPAPPPPSPRT